MIAAWMLYCVAIAVLFVVVGEALERALHLAGRATRWAWVAALVASYVVPAAAWLRPSAFGALPVPLAQPVVAGLAATGAPSDPQQVGGALPATPSFSLGDLDATLTWAWGLSSAALLLSLGVAALRLAALRRGWRSASVDGWAVLVSDNVGPAVAGLWRPRVVLPEWALRLGEAERRLMLAHEDEHVRARDPCLLVAATAALLLAPWNPVVWWQVRRLRLAVEMDCDARVLARAGDAPAYGELLLRVGQRRARLPLGAPALGEPVSFLGRRIRRMVTALPRWRWAGATAAGIVAAAAIIAACEAPRPVGPQASSDRSAVVETERGPYSPGASYLRVLAHEYHPEVFAHPLPGAAVAFVFDAQDSVVGHAAGVREARDDGCLGVVDRLVPAFQTRKWSSSGCAGAYQDTTVVVYWKSLRNLPARKPERDPTGAPAVDPSALSVSYLRVLAHEYHPEVFAHPLPARLSGRSIRGIAWGSVTQPSPLCWIRAVAWSVMPPGFGRPAMTAVSAWWTGWSQRFAPATGTRAGARTRATRAGAGAGAGAGRLSIGSYWSKCRAPTMRSASRWWTSGPCSCRDRRSSIPPRCARRGFTGGCWCAPSSTRPGAPSLPRCG